MRRRELPAYLGDFPADHYPVIRMESALPADRDPSQREQQRADGVDILDTAEAGATVIRGSVLRLGAYATGTLVTVASSAMVIRHLGVVNSGLFITVMAVVMIVATLSDLGLTSVAVRDYSTRVRSERKRLLRNLMGIRVSLALCASVAAVSFALIVGYPSVMVLGTAVAALGTLVLILQDGCSVPLQVGLRFRWVAGLQFAIQVGVAIEAVLFVLAGAGLLPFFALQLPIALPALLVTTVVGGQDARAVPTINAGEWRRMIRRILPYSGAVVLSVIYFQIAQIMVSLLSSSRETGYFGVSFRVLVSFTALPSVLVAGALPLLARAAHDEPVRFDYAGVRLAETMAIAGCGVALTAFLGARFAIDVVAGPHFHPSVMVLRILSVALVGTFLIGARGYALLSLDRLRAMLVSNAVALFVVLAVGVPLIRSHGAIGAAVAMVAAELTLAGGYDYALTRGRPALQLGRRFVVAVATTTLGVAIVMTALALPPVASAAVGSTLYVSILLGLGVVPPEILDAFRRRRSTTSTSRPT